MLRIENLRVDYDGVAALDGVDLVVGDGEVMCVLGPSGCGKTTLLRTIAGLEMPDAGTVARDGGGLLRLALGGLAGFEHRGGHGLSGGESQRVALARAIAPAPALLMLAEPLGALDR